MRSVTPQMDRRGRRPGEGADAAPSGQIPPPPRVLTKPDHHRAGRASLGLHVESECCVLSSLGLPAESEFCVLLYVSRLGRFIAASDSLSDWTRSRAAGGGGVKNG